MTTGGASHTAKGYGRVLNASNSHQDLGQSLISHLLFVPFFMHDVPREGFNYQPIDM